MITGVRFSLIALSASSSLIDLTIRLIDGTIYVVLTTDGRLYNPFSDESLMKSDNVVELSKLNCEFDYGEVLGFNREYIVFNK